MNKSHLYPGFKYANYLPSIATQRLIQKEMLQSILDTASNVSLLSLGCAFGDEMNVLLYDRANEYEEVWAIDLAPVEKDVCQQPFALELGRRFQWRQIDLLEVEDLPNFGTFTVTQCGFTFHDVKPENKDRAFSILANSVRQGGWVVFSDIFVDAVTDGYDSQSYKLQVESIYNSFLDEASDANERGILDDQRLAALVGDGSLPGLRRSLNEAIQGSRDFFETLTQTQRRMTLAGLHVQRVVQNMINSRLTVILAKRPGALPE
jgi:hypothetical protein